MAQTTHELDALSSLRDSFALHLSASRSEKTARIYLAALDVGRVDPVPDLGVGHEPVWQSRVDSRDSRTDHRCSACRSPGTR